MCLQPELGSTCMNVLLSSVSTLPAAYIMASFSVVSPLSFRYCCLPVPVPPMYCMCTTTVRYSSQSTHLQNFTVLCISVLLVQEILRLIAGLLIACYWSAAGRWRRIPESLMCNYISVTAWCWIADTDRCTGQAMMPRMAGRQGRVQQQAMDLPDPWIHHLRCSIWIGWLLDR